MTAGDNFKIDKAIPIPKPSVTGQRGWCYALAHAAIGDSLFFPGAHSATISRTTFNYGSGWTTSRKVDGGVRVWKIAEPPFPEGLYQRKKDTAVS